MSRDFYYILTLHIYLCSQMGSAFLPISFFNKWLPSLNTAWPHCKLPFIFLSILIFLSTNAIATPCDKIDHRLNEQRKVELGTVISQQLQVTNIDVLQSFKLDAWSIILVDTHESDEAFLFYSGDPKTNHYITLWSGSAKIDEEQNINNWLITNAHDIPVDLANCFAWYVTKGRNM